MTWISMKPYLRLRLKLSLAAVCLPLLGTPNAARAQENIPAIQELPARVAAGRPDLVARRAALLSERQALHAKKDSYNAACSAVEEGSAREASCRGAGAALRAEIKAHVRQSVDFNVTVKAAVVAGIAPDPLAGDPSVVDARDVPTGLPKSVEAEIPDTPAGNRLRKGFQAVAGHDWNVAHAWFQDALRLDPGNAGIMRLIDLAEYAMSRRTPPRAAVVSPAPPSGLTEGDKATLDRLDRQMEEQYNEELSKTLHDFDQSHPVLPPVAVKANWQAFFDALFKKAPRTSGVSGVRD